MDFNLGLSSFEPNVTGVRNLINFALRSKLPTPPRLIFVSTVTVVTRESYSILSTNFGVLIAYNSHKNPWVDPRRTSGPGLCNRQRLQPVQMGLREGTRGRRSRDFPPPGNRQGWTGQRRGERLLESSRVDTWDRAVRDSYKIVAIPGKGHLVTPFADKRPSAGAGAWRQSDTSGSSPSPCQPDVISMGRRVWLYCPEVGFPSRILPQMALKVERDVRNRPGCTGTLCAALVGILQES